MDKTKKITAKGILKALTGEYSFILSFIVLCILGRVFNEKFFTWNNLTNLFVQGSMIGLIAMGMTMVISAGMIDISVGSQAAPGSCSCSAFAQAASSALSTAFWSPKEACPRWSRPWL